MKQKQVLLSLGLLCLGLLAMVRCAPPRLPAATDLYFNENVAFVQKGNGSYLNNISQQEISDAFGSTLSDELKHSLVNVQRGSFANTPFRLEINQFRLKQSRGSRTSWDTCGISITRVQKVRMDLRITLYKNGQKLKSWNLCAKDKEGVDKVSPSYSYSSSSSDECPDYEADHGSVNVLEMVRSCARKVYPKIVRRMKRNL